MNMMRSIVGAVTVSLSAIMAHAAGEAAYLVKITGFDRKPEVQVMSAADYKAFEKTIKAEQRYFSEAVSQVAKEWRADELNKGIPFAGNKLVPRAIVGTAEKYISLDRANEALSKIEEQQAKREERELKTKKNKTPSKDQLKKDSELSQAAELVKVKLDDMIAKGTTPGTGVQNAAPGANNMEAGGVKLNAAANKAGNK
ncbi:MAG: hypothetical protein WCO42_01650 [bacterium]